MSTHTETLETTAAPDTTVDAAGLFSIKTKMRVPAFTTANDHVPEVDTAYRFDRDTTLASLAGFASNRSGVMIQGYHGTGKSTHIEQVAARLNWPCIRINLIAISAASI
jgi:cobaltochelatase CobS